MTAVLGDHGADSDHQWSAESIFLGLKHLVVTPESAREKFPHQDSVTDMVITADARLDNRGELGQTFGINPAELASFPDSALILRAFQRWGADCPQRLLGDYAFAIWNPSKKTLFCARDHIGAKPFYYSLTAKQFVFASDINAILALPEISEQLNESYLATYLQDKEFSHQESTFFKSIQKLPPAHSLTVDPAKTTLNKYWFPEDSPDVRFKSDKDYATAFLEIYSQAIRDCLRTKFPVGVHLSCGLDSSSVATLTARELRSQGRKPPTPFSWLPPPEGSSRHQGEYSLIEAVCRSEGLIPHYQFLTPEDYISILQRDTTREPNKMSLCYELAVQRRAASSGIRVILSGLGGDEGVSFNGRGYFPGLLLQGKLKRLFQESSGNRLKFIIIHALLPLLPHWVYSKVINLTQGKWPFGKRFYIDPDFARHSSPLKSNPYRQTSVRQTQLDLLNHGYLTDRLAAWANEGARHKISYHYPLLDRRVLEFALGLPPEQFRRGQWKRWLMRNALDGILPHEVCWKADKTEPFRLQSSKPLKVEALRQVGQLLTGLSHQPTRSDYLDMTRLIADLTTNLNSEKHKFGKLQLALSFLDF